MEIFIGLLALPLLIYIIFLLSYSMFLGAPFAALSRKKTKTIFELISPEKGKRFADLGSGDGRIVIEASKYGLSAVGYEINPLLYFISKNIIKKQESKAKIFLKDYWNINLRDYDYIYIWGTQFMMGRLEKKLQKELKPGAKVISNHYKFPSWEIVDKKNDFFLYVKADSKKHVLY